MKSRFDRFEKIVNTVSSWFNWIAGAGLVAMLALITADIIGNKVFKSPVPGAIEFVGFLGVVAIAGAIAHTQVLGGHIEVEFLVRRLSSKAQNVVISFVTFLGIVLFAAIAWRSVDYGIKLQKSGEVSMTQEIPFYPFVHFIALCAILVCFVLIVQLLKNIFELRKK
jgi:TRAP-type C4-dicarboxylate transport system permease small subunit